MNKNTSHKLNHNLNELHNRVSILVAVFSNERKKFKLTKKNNKITLNKHTQPHFLTLERERERERVFCLV